MNSAVFLFLLCALAVSQYPLHFELRDQLIKIPRANTGCASASIALNNKAITCLYAKDAIVVDGLTTDSQWASSNQIMFRDQSGKSKNVIAVNSLWDERYLYFIFQVVDKDLTARQTRLDHSELFLDDMVEFLIDVNNDKDSCWNTDDFVYHINILGQKKDDQGTTSCISNSSWNGNALYAVQLSGSLNMATDFDMGYVVEVAVPWQELGFVPKAGGEMAVDFANGDNGNLFDWVGAMPFRSPFAFGTLLLSR